MAKRGSSLNLIELFNNIDNQFNEYSNSGTNNYKSKSQEICNTETSSGWYLIHFSA